MFQMAILLELQWTMEFVNTQVLVEAFKIGIWINFTLVWNTNGLLRWNEKQTQQRTRIFSGIFHTLQNLLCILPSTYSSRVILCTKTVLCNECSYGNIKFKLDTYERLFHKIFIPLFIKKVFLNFIPKCWLSDDSSKNSMWWNSRETNGFS